MDEAFWSNVVKRWAEASESVIRLKKELAALQSERALDNTYNHDIDARQDAFDGPHSSNPRTIHENRRHEEDDASLSGPSKARDELKDAEVGLSRAKEEYKRLQSELAVSSERVQALSREKEELRARHEEEISKLKATIQTLRIPTLRSRPSDLSSNADTLRPSKRAPYTRSSDVDEPRNEDLERKIELLMSSLEAREADTQALQHELESTKEKLAKSEENQRLLLRSITKLQQITRTSFDQSLLHSVASRKSLRTSVSSNGGSLRGDEDKKLRSHKSVLSSSTQPLQAIENTKDVDVQIPPRKQSLLARIDVLSSLPAVACPKLDTSQNMFDRDFLKFALGNGVETLATHFSDSQDVDIKSLTSSYLCPTLNHHPWCPTTPGQHGFIFVGLGKDKNVYNVPVIRNLFVGLAKKNAHRRLFRYLGRYRVSRVASLTVDEWMGLSLETQKMLAKLFKDKENDIRELDDLLAAFDLGKLSFPCVQLQFIGFDSDLYDALSSMKTKEWTH